MDGFEVLFKLINAVSTNVIQVVARFEHCSTVNTCLHNSSEKLKIKASKHANDGKLVY